MLGMEGEVLKGHLDMILLAAIEEGPAHATPSIERIRSRSGGAFDLPRVRCTRFCTVSNK